MTKPEVNLKRSILYVPGSNSRALSKIHSLMADGYILDLEDAVAPSAKEEARENVCEFLRNNFELNSKLIIRINHLDSKWGIDDLNAICGVDAKNILLPKVEKPEDILKCSSLIATQGIIRIWAMIETPLGVLNAHNIATSSRLLKCLVMGTSDLVNDIRARHTPDRIASLYSLSHSILAARASGIDIIDGVHLDLGNDVDFKQSCLQGRDLGFDGKSLIHPSQIEFANETYSPTAKEIEHSTKILSAYDRALVNGDGVTVVDGKLIENMHVESAKNILHMANQINK